MAGDRGNLTHSERITKIKTHICAECGRKIRNDSGICRECLMFTKECIGTPKHWGKPIDAHIVEVHSTETRKI